jgi:hypothetical protein
LGDGVVRLWGATASGPITGLPSPSSIAAGTQTFELNKYLLSQCVPDAVALVVSPASAAPIVASGTVYVASGGLSNSQILTAIAEYLATVPVGGLLLPPGGPRVIPRSSVIKAIATIPGGSVAAVELFTPSSDVVVTVDQVGVLDVSSAFSIVVLT